MLTPPLRRSRARPSRPWPRPPGAAPADPGAGEDDVLGLGNLRDHRLDIPAQEVRPEAVDRLRGDAHAAAPTVARPAESSVAPSPAPPATAVDQASGSRTPGTNRKPAVSRAPMTPAPMSVARAPQWSAAGALRA